jgi:nitrite reductase/ring-hydroxylating ferredoxin subunit
MARHVVARASELPPGSRKLVEVEGRSIGVFNVDGQLFALRDRCPHQGGPLCSGRVSGSVTSSRPGEYLWDGSSPVLRCPWHGWEFDMRTGQSWFDPARTRVKSYQVERERGPYVAETYRVERDEELVVVEV